MGHELSDFKFEPPVVQIVTAGGESAARLFDRDIARKGAGFSAKKSSRWLKRLFCTIFGADCKLQRCKSLSAATELTSVFSIKSTG
jgi:hypothetical protein